MLWFLRMFWKSLVAGMFLLGIFWLPADVESYNQALGPWQRLWALVSRETLLWIFALGLFGWLVWTDARPFLRGRLRKKFPPRHREICSQLADEIATLRSDSLTAAVWGKDILAPTGKIRALQFQKAAQRIDELTGQILYDDDTVRAVQHFLSLCIAMFAAVVDKQPTDERREAIERATGPLFEMLHGGKRLNPALIPEPQWPEGTVTKRLP